MLRKLLLCSFLLAVVPGLVSAKIALNQDFEDLPTGQIPTEGVGSLADANGLWQPFPFVSSDPSIVVDPADPVEYEDPNDAPNKCVRVSLGNSLLKGHSNAAPIDSDEPFLFSWSQYCVQLPPEVGVSQTYFWADAEAFAVPTNALGNSSVNNFYVWNTSYGSISAYDALNNEETGWQWLALWLEDAGDTWVDFKVHVKTRDDGTGMGLYDVYWKSNGTFVGNNVWERIVYDWRFDSSKMHDGFNTMYVSPRGGTVYYDDISIATEPVDCQSSIVLGQNYSADLTGDCKVDIDDMFLMASSWLDSSLTPADPNWNKVNWYGSTVPEGPGSLHLILGTSLLWDWSADPTNPPTDPNTWVADPEDPNDRREVVDGILIVRDSDASFQDSAAYLRTNELDPNFPILVETRLKIEGPSGDPYNVALQFTNVDYGYSIQDWNTNYFDSATNPSYAEPNGFITMRFLTTVVDSNTEYESTYWKNLTTGKWDHIVNTPLWTERINEPGNSRFAMGDLGGLQLGDYYWDYLLISQDPDTAADFVESLEDQERDIDENGIVDLGDFAELASQWLLSDY